jgi:hypothetical protein
MATRQGQVMGYRKRFDRELYEQNDKLAKESVMKLIDKRIYRIEENPKKRGVDLQVYRRKDNKLVFNIETEIKRVWKEKAFQYDSVQFPERKAKFAKLAEPTLFVMFNKDQSSYLVVRDKDMLKSPCVEVPNKYCFKDEYFYQVPLKKVKFNEIKSVIKEIDRE